MRRLTTMPLHCLPAINESRSRPGFQSCRAALKMAGEAGAWQRRSVLFKQCIAPGSTMLCVALELS